MATFVWKNIVLVGLDSAFVKQVAQALSGLLDMHHADLEEFIEYELIDRGAVLEKCGIDYLKKCEGDAVENVLGFENTVISSSYDIFHEHRRCFGKDNLILFLSVPKKYIDKQEAINLLSFPRREEYLRQQSVASINLKSASITKATKAAINTLEELV